MAVNERQQLEELRRLDELELKAKAAPPEHPVDHEQLTDPHEIDFVKGRQGQMSDGEIHEAIRQYRAIKKADNGTPTQGWTQIPIKKAIPQLVQGPLPEPTPVPPTIPAEPTPSPAGPGFFTPRITLDDLKGATGQSALASGLAMGALTPTPFQPLGFLAGGAGAILAEEGTRRLQENLGEVPGYIAGTVASLLSGAGIGRGMRTPSHPTQFKNTTIESPETQPFTIPPSQSLHEVVPQGGAYLTGHEMLTPPSARIDLHHQFDTGTGQSLFGPLQRINAPEPGMFGGEPIATPLAPKTRLWQNEGLPSDTSFTPRLDVKTPTLATQPTTARVGVTPLPKAAGIDMGAKGPSGEWIPPKDYIEPVTPSRWRQAWNVEKQRWGQEFPVLKTHGDSPVITNIEALHVTAEDDMTQFVAQPWVKNLQKFGDNRKFAPLEERWVKEFKAGRDPQANMPNDFKTMFGEMETMLAEENSIRRRRGLAEIHKVDGPYAPRLTDEDFQLMRSITQTPGGAKATQSIGAFSQARANETLAEGLQHGVTYKDWRLALLARKARSSILKSTDQMMTDLEDGQVIFKTKVAAEQASLTGKAYPADGLPFAPEGGKWWVRSAEERQFLLQNLRQNADGALNNIRQWGQQWIRNPSLVNPLPHIVKNMGLKQMQQALVSGLNPARVIKNTLAYRQAQLAEQNQTTSALDPRLPLRKTAELMYPKGADMIDEFKQVMPFTESGSTLWEIIEAAGPKTMGQRLTRGAGKLNAYAGRKIFAEWDPAMRYGLWREYIRKGMTPQEAANHSWIDLVRYGTKADRIDAWASMPFNFFVPWRVGTMRTMNKALQTAPVRFGLFMGAVDTLRELDYRINGRWTHLPYDYMERPLMTLMTEGKAEALQTAIATLVAGPGGEYMFRSIQNIAREAEGKGQIGDIRTLVWGLAQIYDLWPQYNAWTKDHNPEHITDMLGLVVLGRHATPYGAPHRFGELIPESFMHTHPQVKQGEELRDAYKQHSEVKAIQKQQRDINKYQQPWPIVPAQ